MALVHRYSPLMFSYPNNSLSLTGNDIGFAILIYNSLLIIYNDFQFIIVHNVQFQDLVTDFTRLYKWFNTTPKHTPTS